jgi:MFS family permease
VISRQSIVALEHRNFRLIWIGLLLSQTGSMMQNAALLWHVSLLVRPDQKGIALGTVGLVRFLPIVVLSLVSGVVADAWNRRRLMLFTQVAAASVALALAILAFRGLSAVWPIYVLAALGAAVGTFDLPARQSLVPTLVPREHLPNAISLNMIMFQSASVAGPALGGLIIATTSVAWVYVLNAVSFGCVILALVMMRNVPAHPHSDDHSDSIEPMRESKGPGRESEPQRESIERMRESIEPIRESIEPMRESIERKNDISLRSAIEGLRLVFRSPIIRSTMLLDFFATFFSSATALLPIFAQDILHVGPRGYGWLFAAPAVGALVTSAALVPLVERIDRRGEALLWAVVGYGLATVAFGVSHWFWLSFACLAATGITDTISAVMRSIIRNLETPNRLRGRMIGINMVFFVGGPQLGEFEAGAVASLFGAPVSVISGGLGCLLATAWVAWSTPMMRHYRHRGTR